MNMVGYLGLPVLKVINPVGFTGSPMLRRVAKQQEYSNLAASPVQPKNRRTD